MLLFLSSSIPSSVLSLVCLQYLTRMVCLHYYLMSLLRDGLMSLVYTKFGINFKMNYGNIIRGGGGCLYVGLECSYDWDFFLFHALMLMGWFYLVWMLLLILMLTMTFPIY